MSSDKKIEEFPDKIYPLNFEGYIQFFDEPSDEARDLLDADVVGTNNAERLGDEIACRYSEVGELRKQLEDSRKLSQANAMRGLNYRFAYEETKRQAAALAEALDLALKNIPIGTLSEEVVQEIGKAAYNYKQP